MLNDYIHPISTITATQYIEANKTEMVSRHLPDEQPTMDKAIELARQIEEGWHGMVKVDPAWLLDVWMNK